MRYWSENRSLTQPFAVHNGLAYFAANDAANGFELWVTDGTAYGTQLVDEVNPSASSSSPAQITAVGAAIFFRASSVAVGSELFRYQPVRATSLTTTGSGVYTTGQSVPITITFDAPVTLTGGNLIVSLNSGGSLTIAPFSGTSATGIYTIAAGETSPDLNVTALTLQSGATLLNAHGANALRLLPASNLAVNADVIVNPLAPTTVSGITVNLGATQRSRLTRITVSFSTPVNAALLAGPGAIALTRTTPNDSLRVDVTNGLILSTTSGLVSSLTLTFANGDTAELDFGSLTDGRWQLTIPYLQYASPLNDPILRRLFGDEDNNGQVDGNDFGNFGGVFGTSPGLGNSPFDFNNDGTINGNDLAEFGNRFGTTL